MIGLFQVMIDYPPTIKSTYNLQENGLCHFVNGDSTLSLNPYSFNEYANMLYVDQPIGVGFSYGTDPVTSTVTAAPYVWKLLQAFFAQFLQYENRDFGIFTELYGGHYRPGTILPYLKLAESC
jgi:carboxypeptidase C (cathepsin A)